MTDLTATTEVPVADHRQPFIAIFVLISGVLGGLAMVITFIFFCKYCFKKKQHLTNNETVKKTFLSDRERKNYEILPGETSTLTSPMPVEAYLQQPKNYDAEKNSDGKSELITLDEDTVIVHISESMSDTLKGETSRQGSTDKLNAILFPKCHNGNETPSHKAVDSAQVEIPGDPVIGAKSLAQPQLDSKNLLSIPTMAQTRERSRSFPKRELPAGPKLSPDPVRGGSHHANSQYYASIYDRKWSLMEESGNWGDNDREPIIPKTDRRRASVQTEPRYPLDKLPRSHQIIIDKTSPIHFRHFKSLSSATDNNNDSKIYNREEYSRANTIHGGLISYPSITAPSVGLRSQQQQQLGASNRSYSQQQRRYEPANFTFEPFEDRKSRKQLIRQGQIQGSPEPKPFDQFYQDFNKLRVEPVRQTSISGSSSGSSGREIPAAYLVTTQPSGHLPSRQVRSVDVYDYSQRQAKLSIVSDGRQIKSLDSAVLPPYPHGIAGRLQPVLTRQDTEDDVDRELRQINRAEAEEIKKECKNLWSLRSTFEQEMEENLDDINDPSESQMTVICRYPEIEEQYATTSCTTSFESNTENLPIEENCRKSSTTFLEPPALTHEARKQKYRNLYARRQIQLQQQKGISFETSFESFETVDSTGTDSSRPEMILNSFESNVSYNSNVSNVSQTGEQTDSTVDSAGRKSLAELKNDSGYKSQSTENQTGTQTQLAYDKVTQFPSTGSASLADWDMGAPQQSRLKQLSFETQYDRDSDSLRSEIPSGESFDDGGGGQQQLIRTSYFPPPPLCRQSQPQRDFSVDSKSDQLFREFSRYEPKFDPIGKANRYRHSLDSEVNFRPRLSPEDSIEEEAGGAHLLNNRLPERYYHRPSLNPYDFRKHQVIPVIKLQTDADLCLAGGDAN